MLNDVIRNFDNFFSLYSAQDRNPAYEGFTMTYESEDLAVNLYTHGDNLSVMVEMPGIKKEDLTIEVTDRLLHIASKRKLEYLGDDIVVHRLERENFDFDRSIKLPFSVVSAEAKADYTDGILRIELTKSEAEKPHLIKVD